MTAKPDTPYRSCPECGCPEVGGLFYHKIDCANHLWAPERLTPAPRAVTREELAGFYDTYLGPVIGNPEHLERLRYKRIESAFKFADAILAKYTVVEKRADSMKETP